MMATGLWMTILDFLTLDADWSRLPDGDTLEDYLPEEDDYSEESNAEIERSTH